MIKKMMDGRFGSGDFHTPDEGAALFYEVFSKASDEDFVQKTWNIVATSSTYPDVKVKEIADMKAGIQVPAK